MTHNTENTEPCIERCGVSAHRGRTSPLNPITADKYLKKVDIFEKDGTIKFDKLKPYVVDAADCLYSGCVVIRNKFIEAAKNHNYREMYRLIIASYAANDEDVPFFIRAVAGFRFNDIWQLFADITADALDYIIRLAIEEELEDKGLLEEDDGCVGMTD